jgi:hypothetical protein
VSDLLLLSAAVKRIVNQAGGPLGLLRLAAMHLSIDTSRRVVFLSRTMPPQLGGDSLVWDCIFA